MLGILWSVRVHICTWGEWSAIDLLAHPTGLGTSKRYSYTGGRNNIPWNDHIVVESLRGPTGRKRHPRTGGKRRKRRRIVSCRGAPTERRRSAPRTFPQQVFYAVVGERPPYDSAREEFIGKILRSRSTKLPSFACGPRAHLRARGLGEDRRSQASCRATRTHVALAPTIQRVLPQWTIQRPFTRYCNRMTLVSCSASRISLLGPQNLGIEGYPRGRPVNSLFRPAPALHCTVCPLGSDTEGLGWRFRSCLKH